MNKENCALKLVDEIILIPLFAVYTAHRGLSSKNIHSICISVWIFVDIFCFLRSRQHVWRTGSNDHGPLRRVSEVTGKAQRNLRSGVAYRHLHLRASDHNLCTYCAKRKVFEKRSVFTLYFQSCHQEIYKSRHVFIVK